MQQLHKSQSQSPQQQRFFTASELAEFEYCPLSWWHDRFEPAAQTGTEELFARLVELEHDQDMQAPSLPEYRMIEQLLLRRGAFDTGTEQHHEHAEEVEQIQEEARRSVTTTGRTRVLVIMVAVIVVVALLCIAAAIVIH
jgi:hypothetical protein